MGLQRRRIADHREQRRSRIDDRAPLDMDVGHDTVDDTGVERLVVIVTDTGDERARLQETPVQLGDPVPVQRLIALAGALQILDLVLLAGLREGLGDLGAVSLALSSASRTFCISASALFSAR